MATKSGLRVLKQNQILFRENDYARSLYIIQRGQIRLYLTKGRGFVEIAILRAGEVIGEMAFFDTNSRKRSCSAVAIVTTEIIEVSFTAFAKSFEKVNPWFKTIVNTLVVRLRSANTKVKSLESNSVGYGKKGQIGEYVFINNADVVKLLTLIYLTIKAHGEVVDGEMAVDINKLKFYCVEINAITEIKFEEMINLLNNEGFLDVETDKNKRPKSVTVANVEVLRGLAVYVNTERLLVEEKKMKISIKCQAFLKKILDKIKGKKAKEGEISIDIAPILKDFQTKKIAIYQEDLKDAVKIGLCDDILVGKGESLTTTVNVLKLKKIFPNIRFLNAVKQLNENKQIPSKY
ncbi:MAG: cyclic nucleotide-binding domain-containing protein [Bacteriovoracaceae bacterium]|nr:cyclic nucleotide-binding domain-containing protein [Bacteriovoracaceae bacterium]